MSALRRIIFAALAILAAITILKPLSLAAVEGASSPDVEQLLKQLRLTLIKVQGTIAEKKLPELKSVQITLQTGIKTEGGGKVTFFVVSLGDTISSDKVQSIKITLAPPKVTSNQVAATQDFSKEMANAIISVAEAIAASSTQKPQLTLSSLTASIKFISSSKMEGGVKKVELLPVSFDLGANITPTNTQEAVLTFGSSNTEH